MNPVAKQQVLKLYKNLLRYGQQLKHTDKEYFAKRIKKEFKNNKYLDENEKINFNFERGLSVLLRQSRLRVNIDFSRVPVLKDDELEEKFVRGSGPGGQKINKTASAVCLKHIPTGIVVKCHQSRSLVENRKTARSLLTNKLDKLVNGENSVENQKKVIEAKKHLERSRRRNKLREIKEEWKKDQEPS